MFEINNPIETSKLPMACEVYTFDATNNDIPSFAYRLFDDPDMLQAFQTHNHKFPEFILVTEGHLYASVNKDEVIEYSAGDIFCVSPYEFHMGHVRANEKTTYYCFQFSLSLLTRAFDPLKETVTELKECKVKFAKRICAEDATECASLILKLYSSPKSTMLSCLCAIADIHQFAALLIGKIGLTENEESINASFVLKVNKYVSEHFHEPISTNEIADHLGIEKKYFCKLFKDNFGDNFINHLNMLRINRAVHLIQFSEKTLTEISEEVGYSDYHYFCRCFTKYMGKPPTSFIKK